MAERESLDTFVDLGRTCLRRRRMQAAGGSNSMLAEEDDAVGVFGSVVGVALEVEDDGLVGEDDDSCRVAFSTTAVVLSSIVGRF
mmetsp:Transcript_33642/g.61834  ORF Transcript_33642/g.61834 Transcript_33642/m.61834 type:complete len:85 (-) Transcript_33642:29-283(-)